MSLLTWFCPDCGYLRAQIHVCARYVSSTSTAPTDPDGRRGR
ncbi:MAG: hypothetical protein K0Q52_111 [Microbacterium sp.]|jgi:hypothetical protein|nr:hypothetical protein [Microbacterium sp.]